MAMAQRRRNINQRQRNGEMAYHHVMAMSISAWLIVKIHGGKLWRYLAARGANRNGGWRNGG
jgi:hypothetical protein